MIVRIVSCNSEFANLHRSVGSGIVTLVVDPGIQGNGISLHAASSDGNDIQDTPDTFRIVFRPRISNYFDGLDRIGRETLQHFFRVIAHHAVRLSVHMHLEVAATIHLNVFFSVYRYKRYLSQHLQRRIGLGIRVVFHAISHLVHLCFDQRLLSNHFHAFQHLRSLGHENPTQIDRLDLFRQSKITQNRILSYGRERNDITTWRF